MDDLITRHLMAETTAGEERQLLVWRRASPSNERTFQRRVRLWELLGAAAASPELSPPSAADIAARAGIRPFPGRDVRRRSGPFRSPDRGTRQRLRLLVGLAVAAGIAALALALPSFLPETRFGAVEFIAGPDQAHTIRLDDGTVVRLAPGSRLQFSGKSSRERRVSFEGVGYFAVARDESRPFIIHTEGGDAEVLGTRFELRAERDAMRVVVVEGRVAMESVGERRELVANQVGHAAADQPPTVADVEDVNDLLGWVGGLLVFQATPLRQAVQELERQYGVEIEVLNAELEQRQVTAWLREQSFDAALTAICGAVNATCVIHRDRATMDLP